MINPTTTPHHDFGRLGYGFKNHLIALCPWSIFQRSGVAVAAAGVDVLWLSQHGRCLELILVKRTGVSPRRHDDVLRLDGLDTKHARKSADVVFVSVLSSLMKQAISRHYCSKLTSVATLGSRQRRRAESYCLQDGLFFKLFDRQNRTKGRWHDGGMAT